MTMPAVVTNRLAELEHVIERNLPTFLEVGDALREIRDARLYKATHATFDAYCKERWGWSRQRAHQLITATRVREVSTRVDIRNEKEARRELKRLRASPSNGVHPELRRGLGTRRPAGEQFDRTLHAIAAHTASLVELYESVDGDARVAEWVSELKDIRRSLATITHHLEES